MPHMPLSEFGLMSGGPLVFHNGVVRVSLQKKLPSPSALDAPMGCYRRVPPHGKLASIGIWLRANQFAP